MNSVGCGKATGGVCTGSPAEHMWVHRPWLEGAAKFLLGSHLDALNTSAAEKVPCVRHSAVEVTTKSDCIFKSLGDKEREAKEGRLGKDTWNHKTSHEL